MTIRQTRRRRQRVASLGSMSRFYECRHLANGPKSGPARESASRGSTEGASHRDPRAAAQVASIDRGPAEGPLRVTLAQMMRVYREPGLSVAVIAHDSIDWANGYGVTSARVEHGTLSLDADVNR